MVSLALALGVYETDQSECTHDMRTSYQDILHINVYINA